MSDMSAYQTGPMPGLNEEILQTSGRLMPSAPKPPIEVELESLHSDLNMLRENAQGLFSAFLGVLATLPESSDQKPGFDSHGSSAVVRSINQARTTVAEISVLLNTLRQANES